MTETTRQYLTIQELSHRWRVSRSTVRRWIRRLHVWRPSATVVRIPLSEVERVEREWML
jgi:excisionase family DNA binding protein